ncbi:MAG: hypothetical protein K2I61_06880, partial [Muribaculaceae bacterium]|nr:hypothetical protein [Muribaculaceae bacterium]
LDGRGCLVIKFDSGEEFVTNDLAEIKDADGFVGTKCGEFRILGRIDHVIITGGRKVNPLDVERRISHLIDRPFIVTSEPDCKWGRIVVLRIEGESADIDETEGDGWKCRLHSALRDILQPYETPKEIEVVAQLPRTPNGKIKR